MNLRKATLATALLLATAAQPLWAECPVDGATPINIGPVNPINGFAEYVVDSQGTALQLCLNSIDGQGTPPNCFYDPAVAGNFWSEQTGFGAEAFWWSGDTSINTIAGNGQPFDALLVMAVEAAYINPEPANGEQFPFTRLRIRIDVPEPGIYKVTHPYGEITYTVRSVDAGQEIRDSFDIEFAPNAVHQGRVGPFLTWDATLPAPPAGFLSDGVTEHTVVGSPCGTNFFRVEAVALDGITPIDLDGAGNSVVQNDLFIITGQTFDQVVQAPLSVSRASYERTAAGPGQVDIFAASATTANVSVSGGPNLPAGPHPLSTDGSGKFQATVLLGDATTLPATIAVEAVNDGNDPSTVTAALVDVVTITRSDYDLGTGVLTIEAHSSDEQSPPTLTAGNGLGDVSGGTLNIALPFPPATVTVVSSAGGMDTEPVHVVAPAAGGNNPPVAQDDNVTTDEDTTATFDLLADNGFGVDSDPDAGDSVVVASLQIGTPPAGSLANNLDGTVTYTPPANFNGTDSFTYTVRDTFGAFSNSAVVTITVNPVGDAPVAVDDLAGTAAATSVVVNVLANDSDPDGDAIMVTASTDGTNGTVTVAADGSSVTYTPNPNFTGTDTFVYTISDTTGLTASATVAVTVTQAGDELTVARAQFRIGQARWDIRGTSTVPGPGNTVTIHLGPDLTGPVLGTADVDNLGAWRFVERNSATAPDATGTVSLESTAGGVLLNVSITIN